MEPYDTFYPEHYFLSLPWTFQEEILTWDLSCRCSDLFKHDEIWGFPCYIFGKLFAIPWTHSGCHSVAEIYRQIRAHWSSTSMRWVVSTHLTSNISIDSPPHRHWSISHWQSLWLSSMSIRQNSLASCHEPPTVGRSQPNDAPKEAAWPFDSLIQAKDGSWTLVSRYYFHYSITLSKHRVSSENHCWLPRKQSWLSRKEKKGSFGQYSDGKSAGGTGNLGAVRQHQVRGNERCQ